MTASCNRRAALLLGVTALMPGAISACSAPSSAPTTPAEPTGAGSTPSGATVTPSTQSPRPGASTPGRPLLAYFSRPGENYYRGGRRNLEVGNTEVLARMIADLVDCDVHRIEAADPYSSSYDDTVARNVREQNADTRPAISNPLTSLDQYDTVLLGSPIWNVRPPMIMASFVQDLDFTGVAVHPFVTFAVSGLGRAERDYTSWCDGARIAAGLAVQGEEADEHRRDVVAWLRSANLLT